MNNPQAFPGDICNLSPDGVDQIGNHTFRSPGMTLRDYFASSIISGLYASDGIAPEPEKMAKDAYAIADAMLEARATPAQTANSIEMSPEFTDTARSALLWVLWHHQGGSSKVGQQIRFALGMGEHEHLSDHQVREAKRWGALPQTVG